MKRKEPYKELAVQTLEFLRQNTVLAGAGSITAVTITANEGDVTVKEYEDDDTFKENGFGDISF